MRSSIDLASLLDPLSPSAFFADNWQQEPLVRRSPASDRLAHLVSVRDIDFLVSSLSADCDWLRLVKDSETLPAAYVQSEERFVDLLKVRNAYHEGYTLVLKKLHRRWLPITQLCRSLEADLTTQGVLLSAPVGANLYFTPRSAQGFPLHYDDHDVLILQIDGTKRWRIFESYVPFPLDRPSAPIPEDACGRQLHDVVVEPGDVLYIPRGFCHDASTTSSPSLHLTVGIYPHTWLDLVTRLMKGDTRFRQALPIIQTDRVPDVFVEQFRSRLEGLLRTATCVDAIGDLRESFSKRIPALPDAGFQQLDHLDEITLDSVIGKREGVLARVFSDADLMTLLLPGSVFRGPLIMEPIFRLMLDRDAFRVRDLPDFITDSGKLDLAKAMIKEGLLRQMDDAQTA